MLILGVIESYCKSAKERLTVNCKYPLFCTAVTAHSIQQHASLHLNLLDVIDWYNPMFQQ